MSKQIVLQSPPEHELVCTKCKYFIQLEDSFYCSLLIAYLSEQTLSIPCDFQENTQNPTLNSPDKPFVASKIKHFRALKE